MQTDGHCPPQTGSLFLSLPSFERLLKAPFSFHQGLCTFRPPCCLAYTSSPGHPILEWGVSLSLDFLQSTGFQRATTIISWSYSLFTSILFYRDWLVSLQLSPLKFQYIKCRSSTIIDRSLLPQFIYLNVNRVHNPC